MITIFAYLIPTVASAFLLWLLLVTTEEQKNTYHTLLFITVFFVNLSYLCVSISKTTEEALLATKFTYFSGTFLMLFMLECVLQICNIRIHRAYYIPLILLNVEVITVVFLAGFNTWHYRSVQLVNDNGIVYLSKEYGPHHNLYLAVIILNMILPAIAITWAFLHRKKVSWINAFLLGLVEIITLILYFAERILSIKIELLPYAYLMVEITILIILRRTAIYDVNTNVQLSISSSKEQGYVVLDSEKRFVGCNDVAKKYFPEVNSLELDRRINQPFLRREFGHWVDDSLNGLASPKLFNRCGDIIKITVRPFYKNKGKAIAGYIINIADDTETQNYISRLKESKALAEQMAQNAEAANRYKSEFLANISHEIRTPINAVLGFNEMIIRESGEDKITNYALDIKKSGTTMLGLINDLLDLSKIEAGKMQLVPVSFDLVSALSDVINMTGVRAQDKGLNLNLDIAENIPRYLFGDDVRIKQILTNILTNAVKYTNKGSVTFKAYCGDIHDDLIDLTFEIADTGIGMKEDTIKHLFEPYERDEMQNKYVEGTGLGMSITRKLLSLMNSELHVESEYEKGSVFSFTISLKVCGEATVGDLRESLKMLHDSLKQYNVSFTAPDAKILIVDDTLVNIRVFKGLLKRTLVNIDEATSGPQAIELTKSKKYDVIFIDHMMPDMDGIETFNAIRNDSTNPNHDTPKIMMTANVTSNSKENYISVGFDDYIGKPVDPILLESMLKRFL